jgi:hypothetical protein
MNDPVNPQYYDGDACMRAIEQALGREQTIGFLRGTIMHYVWRSGRKPEDGDVAGKITWYSRRLEKWFAPPGADKPPSEDMLPSRSETPAQEVIFPSTAVHPSLIKQPNCIVLINIRTLEKPATGRLLALALRRMVRNFGGNVEGIDFEQPAPSPEELIAALAGGRIVITVET